MNDLVIENRIYTISGIQVMLDSGWAETLARGSKSLKSELLGEIKIDFQGILDPWC
ncbi:MAG TPA: hypothetical protein VLA71_14105 [Algoriphagus sp.]|nr:hypothetical protein [Algoriphagus sp.]